MMDSSQALQPLLNQKKQRNYRCPGCDIEYRKESAKGPLKLYLAFASFVVLCNALPLSSLFPFVYFMVRDFGIAKSETRISTYAGFVGAALMFGRALTSIFWGMLADIYGRKPVMVFGTATIVVFNTLFGFSKSFWLALISRFLMGLLNGMLGPVRAYVSEICTLEYQAFGLAMVATMWAVGLIIGPAIGGYLSQPSDKYPSLFPSGSLFDQFPYALPCLCISVAAFLGVIVGLFLPETLHKHDRSVECNPCNSEKKFVPKDTVISIKEGNDIDIATSRTVYLSFNKIKWKNKGMISSIFLYFIWGLHDMAYSEIFSLWAVSPKQYGGLGLTTSDVGTILSVSGFVLLVFQLVAFAPLANRFGAIQLIQCSIVITLPLVVVFPLIQTTDGVTLWSLLISANVIKNILSVISQRGFANGVSMSLASFGRAVGPACAGTLFSWAQERLDSWFLPGMWIVFFILAVVALVSLIFTFEPILPKSLLHPLPERPWEDVTTQKLERSSSFTLG
ncbi:hypothetical protein KP509_09G015600 [Ceratopteris richardii]|uniref:Major facilitator superfamily (MFS) profile domain-containing protein n=1 Tax=Ceratopteris richardii TaxID=49495 RepID=A0A8T2U2J4_CERRI|nr:hypothetical protein KP509_09G015600 [Ceratopteris richardii]